MEAESPPRGSSSGAARCAAHGLLYDPRIHEGCVVCRRPAANALAAVPIAPVARASALFRTLCVSAALLVCIFVVGRLALDLGTQQPARSGTRGSALAVRTLLATPSPASQASRGAAARRLRVLFVGDSFSSRNALPDMIAKLAQADGQALSFEPRAETLEGFRLRDHIVANRLPGGLADGVWDAVVLQEQDRSAAFAPERDAQFFAAARVLDASIHKVGARTVFCETSARRDGDPATLPGDSYAAMQDRIVESYATIAHELHAELVPIGRIWRRLHERRPQLQLWAKDGTQPSVAGSYLAACAFYAHFYQRSPVGNRYDAQLDTADALAIQDAVATELLPASPELARTSPTRPGEEPTAGTADARDERSAAARERERLEAEQDRERHARIEAELNERSRRAARDRVPVALYTTAWCPSCKKAKAYLRAKNILFVDHDIEDSKTALEACLRLNPKGSIPTIDVDGQVMVGWSEQRFTAMLDGAARAHAR